MSQGYATPQDAEDAFYDAIDEADPEAMAEAWDTSDDIFSLLPMGLPQFGRDQVLANWQSVLGASRGLEIQVRHLHWIESREIAIHCVEERVILPNQPPGTPNPPLFATNIYRLGPNGWRLIMHQNSPPSPPPGLNRGAGPSPR